DALTDGSVVLAQDTEDLLRVGGLGEGSEPAKVTKKCGDFASMTSEKLGPLFAREQVGDLRDETRELQPLPLHGLKQPNIFDGDDDLVGKCLDQANFCFVERADLVSAECNRADRLVVPQHRSAENRPVATRSADLLQFVLRIS